MDKHAACFMANNLSGFGYTAARNSTLLPIGKSFPFDLVLRFTHQATIAELLMAA
jgi:hypothetical protein